MFSKTSFWIGRIVIGLDRGICSPKNSVHFCPHFCASPAHLFLRNLPADTTQGKPKFPLSKSKYVREENHSLTAPILTPFTKYFCRKGYSAMKGRIAHTIAA